MDTVKFKKSNDVLVVAHRGLSGLETENTASAFVAAGNRSYFGIETDIHVTSDDKFVVIHDDTTERVAKITVNVEEKTLEELQSVVLKDLRAGKSDADYKRVDLRMPTLADYVGICRKYNKKCVLELKNPFSEKDIKALLSQIDSMGYTENMIFISFCLENLIIMRGMSKDLKLQYLVSEFGDKVMQALDKYNLDLDIYYANLDKAIIDRVHQSGHKVNCWTCDDEKAAEKLSAWGVDFITSNILE